MRAAQGGAGREASFGVNIRLPFEQQANEVIAGDRKLINFRYFFTRKISFVKESHAIVLFPGGFGTHDEGFEALTLIQTGKSQGMTTLEAELIRHAQAGTISAESAISKANRPVEVRGQLGAAAATAGVADPMGGHGGSSPRSGARPVEKGNGRGRSRFSRR